MVIGDIVVHFTEGICKCTETQVITMNGITRNYFVFVPIENKTTKLMIPVDLLEKRVRPVMSEDAIHELIKKMPTLRYSWDSDSKVRKIQYDDILMSGNIEKMAGLVKTLYEKKSEFETIGKTMSFADQESLNRSRRILFSEIAYVLKIPYNQVVTYIGEQIS